MTSKNKKPEEEEKPTTLTEEVKPEAVKPEEAVKKEVKEKPKEEKPKRTAKKKAVEEAVAEITKEIKKPEMKESIQEIKEELPKEPSGVKEVAGGEFSVEETQAAWTPKTTLGIKVYKEEIKSIKEIMKLGGSIKEVGIVDKLLPGLKEEIVDVGRVQRVTDSGRRMRFRVVAVIGNGDGYIGIGEGKAKEVGPAIRKAIDHGKLSIREIKRGCGSWECGCGTPHTVPVKISGKSGSVTVTITPAPKGVGLVSGEIAKKILSLAGIKDAWVKTSGHTRTGVNFAHAVFNALVNTNYVKISEKDLERFRIISGSKET